MLNMTINQKIQDDANNGIYTTQHAGNSHIIYKKYKFIQYI